MSVTLDRRRVARHEAGHTAAWLMSGRLPLAVTIDRPEQHVFGQMTRDLTTDGVNPGSAPDIALSVLLGPLAEAQSGWPPEWPLDPDAKDRDARQLAILADYMELDEDSWYSLVRQAQHVAKSKAFKHLVAMIALALEQLDTLDSEELKYLLGEQICRTYGLDVEEASHAA